MTNKEAIKFGIETLEYMRDNYPYLDDERKQAIELVIKVLEQSEERPHGEWVAGERNGEGYDYYCSRCMQVTFEDINRIKFCPNCGARIGKEE